MSRALFQNLETGEIRLRSGLLGAAMRFSTQWVPIEEDPPDTVGDGLPAGCVPPSEDDEGE